MSDPLQIFQTGLAVVGVVSVGVWLLRWVSAFTSKHQELAGVEKQLRDALQHQVKVHSEHAKMLEENYEREAQLLGTRLKQLETELGGIRGAPTRHERALAVVRVASDLAVGMHKNVAMRALAAARTEVELLASLAQLAGTDKARLAKPSEEVTSALRRAGYFMGKVEGSTTAAVHTVVATLGVLERKPDASIQEVVSEVAAEIRAL